MASDVDRFYNLLDSLKQKCRQRMGMADWKEIKLGVCSGSMPFWQECKRGVYLFFDANETRASSDELRVVRVGTHAVKKGLRKSTLWERLKQHRGLVRDGGGYHRKSVFRLLVGDAMNNQVGDENRVLTWGKNDVGVREDEHRLEINVSDYIRNLPFIVLRVDPETDSLDHIYENDRSYLEMNMIGLLSNINRKNKADRQSDIWLGNFSSHREVKESGLWNIKGVERDYDPRFLEVFEHYLKEM